MQQTTSKLKAIRERLPFTLALFLLLLGSSCSKEQAPQHEERQTKTNEIREESTKHPKETPKPITLELRTDKTEITAKTNEEVALSLYMDNTLVEEDYTLMIRLPETEQFASMQSKTFKQEQAGVYTLKAEYKQSQSPEVHITVKPAPTTTPIEPPLPTPPPPTAQDSKPLISSNKSNIKANGTDVAQFSVILNGQDVTEQYTFYRMGMLNSETPLNNNVFSTTKAGSYQFYAQEKQASSAHSIKKQTTSITIIAEDTGTRSDTNFTIFSPGVSLSGGWYDVNKLFGERKDGKGGDGVMCWAAAATNMLEWWIADYKAKGHTLPNALPYGPSEYYESKIFQVFLNNWYNIQGETDKGIHFFFVEPDLNAHSVKYNLINKSFKGYFKNSPQWEKVKAYFSTYGSDDAYVRDYGSYSNWYRPETSPQGLQAFTTLLTQLLSQGVVSMGVGGHEVNLWGAEVKGGQVEYIYITNSDDQRKYLHKIKIVAQGNDVYLDQLIQGAAGNPQNGNGKRIDRLTFLKPFSR